MVSWILCLAACLLAQSAAAEAEHPPRKVALLVGINECLRPSFRILEFAERDVEVLGREFRLLGFEVATLTGRKATREAVDGTLQRLAGILGPKDILLIFLNGQGLQREIVEEGVSHAEAFFCPVDANEDEPATSLALTEMIRQAEASNAGKIVILVDACRDERTTGIWRRGIDTSDFRLSDETAVLLSCHPGQRSRESAELQHGLFAAALLASLRGEAVADTILEWGEVVRETTRRLAAGFPVGSVVRDVPSSHRQEPLRLGRVSRTILGKIQQSRATGMSFTWVPAGEFSMGSTDADLDEVLRKNPRLKPKDVQNQQPQHRIRITRPFYLGRYEVTQREFEKVTGRKPSDFVNGSRRSRVVDLDAGRLPVDSVTWFDALEFCNLLSAADGFPQYYDLSGIKRVDTGSIFYAKVRVRGGSGYRLPTEAEWEYACRAGIPRERSALQSEDVPREGAVESPNGHPRHVDDPAADINLLGIAEMSGNVREWCQDNFEKAAYAGRQHGAEDPVVETKAWLRVVRGGSWLVQFRGTPISYRDSLGPDHQFMDIGFRVARTPEGVAGSPGP